MMHMRVNNSFFWILLILISFVKKSQAHDDNKVDNCKLKIKTIKVKECKVLDSSICKVIDSALTQIKIEKINKKNIPYAKLLSFFEEKGIADRKQIVFTVNNGYDWVDLIASEKTMLLSYKGQQILINQSDPENIMYSFFEPTGKYNDYKLYLFVDGEKEENICLGEGERLINQEIIYFFQKSKKKFFFFKYSYIIDFESFE